MNERQIKLLAGNINPHDPRSVDRLLTADYNDGTDKGTIHEIYPDRTQAIDALHNLIANDEVIWKANSFAPKYIKQDATRVVVAFGQLRKYYSITYSHFGNKGWRIKTRYELEMTDDDRRAARRKYG